MDNVDTVDSCDIFNTFGDEVYSDFDDSTSDSESDMELGNENPEDNAVEEAAVPEGTYKVYPHNTNNKCYVSQKRGVNFHFQRHWNVGDKFAFESNIESVLPLARNMVWTPMPQSEPTEAPFAQKPENDPVGNQRDYTDKPFVNVWADMFLPVIEMCRKFTNSAGKKNGAQIGGQ